LRFRDQKRYADRCATHRTKPGDRTPSSSPKAPWADKKVVTAVFDFSFMGGSMGMAVGEGIVTAARRGRGIQASLIVLPASGGRACRKALCR